MVKFLVIVLALVVLWYLFPTALVFGESMLPTYHERQILLCRRVLLKQNFLPKEGKVYVFKAPYDDEHERLVIKRVSLVVKTREGVYCQLLGDNPEKSYDSRMYGLVKTDEVVAKVILTLTR